MRKSKVNNQFEFNENKWVVSLINTKNGTGGFFGGHAKIIVEGIKKDRMYQELQVGEYHIMEANHMIEQSWIPQFLRNTKSDYTVLYTERNQYREDKEVQYESASSKSWYVSPREAMKMIQDIKDEQNKVGDYQEKSQKFQYAGEWCLYSYKGGHNCTTWAESKLTIAGVGNGKKFTDSSKALPAMHVGTCQLF